MKDGNVYIGLKLLDAADKKNPLNCITVKCTEMSMKIFKARYISDVNSIFLKKGEIYDVYFPIDDTSHRFLAVYLEDMDEPGDYAVPASRFEILSENQMKDKHQN